MANVIIRMDDGLKQELSQKAKDMGLSLSAFIRSTMKERIKKQSIRDKIITDIKGDEVVSYHDFKEELKEMITNAKG